MKKLITLVSAAALTGSLAFANDAEHKVNESVDTSKNPITGTQTTTKKYDREMKHKDGSKSHVSVKEKTKKHKDGTVKTDIEAETQSTSK